MKLIKYANNLKQLRMKANKSRKEVAAAVGVSASSIAMYEQGERIPRDETKIALAKYFKTSVASIFFAN